MNDSYNEWQPNMGQRVLVGKTSKNQNVFRGNGKLYVQGTYGGYYDADGEWIRFDDAPEIYYVRMGSEYSNPETDPNILKTFSTIPLAKQSSKEGSMVQYGSSNETELQQSRIKNMDTYTKYGLLAAGAIGLYLLAKKQGLADDYDGKKSHGEKTYEVRTIDVWGNAKEGYEWNDTFRVGKIELTDDQWNDDKEIIRALKKANFLNIKSQTKFVVHEVGIDGVEIQRARDGYPFLYVTLDN